MSSFLTPVPPLPPEDLNLEQIFHDLFQGLTGIDTNLIFPEWQPFPPDFQEQNTNWIAFGTSRIRNDARPLIKHFDDGTNVGDNVHRHQLIHVHVMCYGPAGMQTAETIQRGLFIQANSDWLKQYNMGLVRVTDIIAAPEKKNQQWFRRYDFTLQVNRHVVEQFATPSLTNFPIGIFVDEPPIHIPLDIESP